MKTTTPKVKTTHDRKWYLIDAKGKTLGRVATQVADLLQGKHKPEFSHHIDVGDYVVVINAGDIHVTGNKLKDKLYRTHSGYLGNLKEQSLAEKLEKKPTQPIELAVSGMLPKNALRPGRMDRLRVYAGAEYKEEAQKPETITI